MISRSSGPSRVLVAGMLAGVLALGCVLALAGSPATALARARHVHRAAASGGPAGNSLNIALAATTSASASSEASGSPASAAVDGDASTDWCSTQWTGTLTVDLGRARSLDGLGLTLGRTATNALVDISAGMTPGSLAPVPQATHQTPPAGDPVYWQTSLQARYVQISVTDSDGTPPCIGELRLFAAAPPAAIPDRGADLSFEPQEEAAGARFTDDGRPGSALSILNRHGLNYVRLRLWVDPPAGYSDLASDLRMARRIAAAGDKLYLDIHYSDFWADPQKQNIPAAWAGQDLAQLSATVKAYTRRVMQAFADQGTPVDMVSIGNEIRNGILWPVGQVDWTAGTGWNNLTTLLKAGVAGARAGNQPGHKLQVMLHFDQGGDNAQSREFYDHMVDGGVPFDVIGLSYYPFWHGTLSAMRTNVDDLATRYHKPIALAESQYAWTLANGDNLGNSVWQSAQVDAGYPASPGGQLSFYNDALSILAQVPGHLGMGLFYWEPEWIPGVGWEPGAGSPNDNLTLFSFSGQALPSVGLFQSPLAVCANYAPHTVPCEVPGGASS
jgi:arabinogalactan endo-1,4-beta-galactosidase